MNALVPFVPTEIGAAMTIADVTDGFALNQQGGEHQDGIPQRLGSVLGLVP